MEPRDEDIDALIRRLASDDPLERRDAARALGDLGAASAVPALVDALRRPVDGQFEADNLEHTSRAAAAVALGRIGDAASAPALLEAIADPFNLGTAASTALGRLRPPPVRELIDATRDQSPWRRARAVAALGEIGDAAAFDAMVVLLRDPEEPVRRAAAASFEKLRDPRAVGPLAELLVDPHSSAFVRSYAAMALGALKSPDAVEPLTQVLASGDANLRRAAARALCRIGDRRSKETLMRVAETDPNKSVRDTVTRYLRPRSGQRQH